MNQAEDPMSGLGRLAELLARRRAVVLSGAGVSTESGIPDYRGADGRLRKRLPMRYQEFARDPGSRARYWARSSVGWPRFARARPNPAHHALARLEQAGWIVGIITQNVDGLHQAAGSRSVLELHGSLSRVRCMACGEVEPRSDVQARIEVLNPGVADLVAIDEGPRPDGDTELVPRSPRTFRIPECRSCKGVLKPDVVFFGENVPRSRVERAWSLFRKGGILLVVGSSLQVYSGRRFVLRAVEHGVPVVIVNRGPTRCDDVADVRVDARLGEVLPGLAGALVPSPADPPIPRRRREGSIVDAPGGAPSASPF